MKITHYLVPALALVAMTQAQAAQAQQACVAPADIGDTVVYAMPIAYDAARTACAGRFAKNGFVARGGEQFIAQFRSRQNAAWPGAFRTMQMLLADEGAGSKAGDLDLLALAKSLPENSLRPFIDGLMGQLIAEEIKPDSCGQIERGMELLSPLPVDNVVGLLGFVAELVDLTDMKAGAVCSGKPAEAAPAKKRG
ncbi:MAG: hypothetical protein ACXIT4_08415 [Erythrobacter sp.]